MCHKGSCPGVLSHASSSAACTSPLAAYRPSSRGRQTGQQKTPHPEPRIQGNERRKTPNPEPCAAQVCGGPVGPAHLLHQHQPHHVRALQGALRGLGQPLQPPLPQQLERRVLHPHRPPLPREPRHPGGSPSTLNPKPSTLNPRSSSRPATPRTLSSRWVLDSWAEHSPVWYTIYAGRWACRLKGREHGPTAP